MLPTSARVCAFAVAVSFSGPSAATAAGCDGINALDATYARGLEAHIEGSHSGPYASADPNACENVGLMFQALKAKLDTLSHDPNRCGKSKAYLESRGKFLAGLRMHYAGCGFE